MAPINVQDIQTGHVYVCHPGQVLQVGRADPGTNPEVPCSDQHVSRRHCTLMALSDGRLRVIDQSTYGTFINDKRLQGEAIACPGDRLVLGHQYELRILSTNPEAATVAAPSGRQHQATPGLSQTDGPGGGLPQGVPRVLGDRYRLTEELGRGGMGVVYKAIDAQTGRAVAIKMLVSEEESESAERFRREARLASILGDCPAIVKVTDHGKLPGGLGLYLVMDFVDGVSLATLTQQPNDPLMAANIVARTARAVAYAHARNVVHRDLKPGNVLVTRAEGAIRLTDFGIAKEDGSGLTVTGTAMGTPNYMAPEQIEDVKRAGPLADVYGLGGILYALLTGRPPFKGKGLGDTLRKVQQGALVPPSEIVKVDPELDRICRRALSLDPAKRHPSADALVHELEDWLKRNRTASGSVRLRLPD